MSYTLIHFLLAVIPTFTRMMLYRALRVQSNLFWSRATVPDMTYTITNEVVTVPDGRAFLSMTLSGDPV